MRNTGCVLHTWIINRELYNEKLSSFTHLVFCEGAAPVMLNHFNSNLAQYLLSWWLFTHTFYFSSKMTSQSLPGSVTADFLIAGIFKSRFLSTKMLSFSLCSACLCKSARGFDAPSALKCCDVLWEIRRLEHTQMCKKKSNVSKSVY